MILRLLVLALLVGPAFAAPSPNSKNDAPERAMFYRYFDENQRPHIEQSISENHLKYGYEELSTQFQVIKKVPPRPTEADLERIQKEKKQRAEAEQRIKDDTQLLRLYSGPKDAELARDRKLDAIQLRIDFSNNSLNRLRSLRAQEAQRAAGFERNGKPVPKNVRDDIDGIDKQIAGVQTEIQRLRVEQDNVRNEFTPTIQRLRELREPDAAGHTPPGN